MEIKKTQIKADGSTKEPKDPNLDVYGRPKKFMVKRRKIQTKNGFKEIDIPFEQPAGHMNRAARRKAGREHARRVKHM